MTSTRCDCGAAGRFQTPTGRRLCDRHWAEYVSLGAAGSTLASGGDLGSAVGTGIAAGHWAGATDDDRRSAERRRRKLAETTGFWARLRVRLFG